jgi:hypothetical protein
MLRRHAPDIVSLVFGILFAGFAAIWLLGATAVIDYKDAWIAGPVILIVAGVLGLLLALRRADGNDLAQAPSPWAPTSPAAGPDDQTELVPNDTEQRAADVTTPIDIDADSQVDADAGAGLRPPPDPHTE